MRLINSRQVSHMLEHNDLKYYNNTLLFIALTQEALGQDSSQILLKSIIAEYLFYIDRKHLTMFFDDNGSYIGRVVSTRFDDDGLSLVYTNPSYSRVLAMWKPGPPNWIYRFEALYGLALPVFRSWRQFIVTEAASLGYARAKNNIINVRTWHLSTIKPASNTNSAINTAILSHSDINSVFCNNMKMESRFVDIANMLANDSHRSWSVKEAIEAIQMSISLRQISTTCDSSGIVNSVIIWAWMSMKLANEFRLRSIQSVASAEWNCGRVPVIVACVGDSSCLQDSLLRFIAQLPDGSVQPYRLRSVPPNSTYTFEAL